MKKLLALLLVAGMLALVNTGCGTGTTKASTPATGAGGAGTQATHAK